MRKVVAVLVLFILMNSCGDNSKEGPSKIYFGEDICERCKMIISEKEFASQFRLSDGTIAKFDDIGCMIHYVHTQEPKQIESIYVTDYDTGNWINAESGYFIWTENIRTPMGYGVLSFNNKGTAQEFASGENGKFLGNLNAASELLMNNSQNQSD
jgi:copper chaperone NosL